MVWEIVHSRVCAWGGLCVCARAMGSSTSVGVATDLRVVPLSIMTTLGLKIRSWAKCIRVSNESGMGGLERGRELFADSVLGHVLSVIVTTYLTIRMTGQIQVVRAAR